MTSHRRGAIRKLGFIYMSERLSGRPCVPPERVHISEQSTEVPDAVFGDRFPRVIAERQIEAAWSLVEVQISEEGLERWTGVDESVRRPDVWELEVAAPAVLEERVVFERVHSEVPVFEESAVSRVRRRDGKVHRAVNGGRIRAQQFLAGIGEVGRDTVGQMSPKKLARFIGRVESAARNSGRSPRYPSQAGV